MPAKCVYMSVTLVLHYAYQPNFVNKGDCGKSSKYKLGQKVLSLATKVPVTVARDRLDLKFKKMLTAQLNSVNHLLRHDRQAQMFIGSEKIFVSSRKNKDMANDIVNALLKFRKPEYTLDKAISK